MKIKIYQHEYTCGNNCCYEHWLEASVDDVTIGFISQDVFIPLKFQDEIEIMLWIIENHFNTEVDYTWESEDETD